MKPLLIAILSFSLDAQTVISLSGPATARPGGTLILSLTGQGGGPDTGAAGLQWTLGLPSGGYTAAVQSGTAAAAANKGIQCSENNVSVCLLYGMNATVIGNGQLAVYTVHVPSNAAPGSASFPLSGLVGVSPAGSLITTAAGTPYTVSVVDKRDLNGDGKVDAADVQLMTNQVISSAGNPAACVDDQNGDGACNLLDVFAVLLKALGLVQ